VARHHPDRLPPNASAAARRAAGDKTSRLNAAYERIRRARGLN
jgi:curved DNA-binding protein CbpA